MNEKEENDNGILMEHGKEVVFKKASVGKGSFRNSVSINLSYIQINAGFCSLSIEGNIKDKLVCII